MQAAIFAASVAGPRQDVVRLLGILPAPDEFENDAEPDRNEDRESGGSTGGTGEKGRRRRHSSGSFSSRPFTATSLESGRGTLAAGNRGKVFGGQKYTCMDLPTMQKVCLLNFWLAL